MKFGGTEVKRFYRPSGSGAPFTGPGYSGDTRFSFQGRIEDALPVVSACITRVSQQLGMLPRMVVDSQGQEVRPPDWLEKPNLYQTGTSLIHMIASSLLLDGNAYIVPARGANRKITALAVADPFKVDYSTDSTGKTTYRFQGIPYEDELLVIRYVSLAERVSGLTPMRALRRLNRVAEKSQVYMEALVDSGGAHQLVFKHPEGFTQDQLRAAAAQFKAKHAGPQNAWIPLMLSADIEVQPINQTNADTRFLELSRLTEARIISYGFNMEPEDFGLGTAQPAGGGGGSLTYKNEPSRHYRFWQNALAPIARLIEEELSALLPPGRKLVLSKKDFLLGGPHDKVEAISKLAEVNAKMVGLQEGLVVSTAEMREIMGLPGVAESVAPDDPEPRMAGFLGGQMEEEDDQE